MRKNVTVRIACLVVALVVLGGAVAFAAAMGSPYETLKRAMLDAVTYRNATTEGMTTISINGVVQEVSGAYTVCGDSSSLSYYFDENGARNSFRYFANGLSVSQSYMAEDGTKWYSAYVSPQYAEYSYIYNNTGMFAIFSAADRDSARMRFMELVIDALVGDLKNNVTMTSENGVRLVQGTLTENQVPELVKAGIDMLVEQSSMYYSQRVDVSYDDADPLDIPMKSIKIDFVHGEAEIDMNGNLLKINLYASASITTIFDDINVMEFNADVSFSDIGTSNAECPIPGVQQLLTADYAKTRFGSEHIMLYFTVNQDGSIDADSVTSTYPGEMYQDAPADMHMPLPYSDENQAPFEFVDENDDGEA